MKYELAKQLKDKGFPNADKRCSFCKETDKDKCNVCEDRTIGLSELIDACGEEFSCLSQSRGTHGNLWHAHCWDWETCPDRECCPDTPVGDTPEEAVAKLWIALQV